VADDLLAPPDSGQGEAEEKQGGSGPVSRVLSPRVAEGDHSSRAAIARRLKQPTRKFDGPDRPATHAVARVLFLLGLAPDGVYQARPVARPAGALLPHLFTLTPRTASGPRGGLFSVALSLAFRPVGVTHHPVLRCPDFPPARHEA